MALSSGLGLISTYDNSDEEESNDEETLKSKTCLSNSSPNTEPNKHTSRFQVVLGPPDVYCNEEGTRTFLGLRVIVGSDKLIEASQALDQCLAEFRLPPFYKDPSFHMSVLWAVGDKKAVLEKMLPKLHSEFLTHSLELRTTVSQCLCKTGNKIFTFPLASL